VRDLLEVLKGLGSNAPGPNPAEIPTPSIASSLVSPGSRACYANHLQLDQGDLKSSFSTTLGALESLSLSSKSEQEVDEGELVKLFRFHFTIKELHIGIGRVVDKECLPFLDVCLVFLSFHFIVELVGSRLD
jgi:hypothetical protein